MNKIFYCFFIVFFVSGCAATGPKFAKGKVGDGEASITVYRPSKFQSGGGYPYLFIDEIYIGSLKNGGYITRKVVPGMHKVVVTGIATGKPDHWAIPRADVEVATKAGESYYLKVDPKVKVIGGVAPRASFSLIEKNVAEAEINECKDSN